MAKQSKTGNEGKSAALCSWCPLKSAIVTVMTVLDIVGSIVTVRMFHRSLNKHTSTPFVDTAEHLKSCESC